MEKTKKIPKGFTLTDDRKIMVSGKSHVLSIPSIIFRTLKLKKGDAVMVYSDGKDLLLVDLKPDKGD